MTLEIQKIYNLPRHSFLLNLCVSATLDPCVFVVKDLSLRPEEVDGSSSSSSPPVDGSSSSSGEIAAEVPSNDTCEVDPYKALVAIASLEDMLYAPKGPVDLGVLYRADSVSMMFKSKEALEQTLEEIQADLRVLNVLLGYPRITFEVKEQTDDNPAVDEGTVFWMPG